MLPPVPASPATLTAIEPKLRVDQPATPRPVTLPSTAQPTALSQNSAIAGQLNIMLLSGPERMSQNLAVLAEVLGSALKIDQRPDESLNDYMGRLIEGIANLPPADRLRLQKLLTQSFAGLQLRTLLEAMANPSGPERATLALYLELYRQTDRDGAMRSVISSYREVAAEGRGGAPGTARPTAANDSSRPSANPQRTAQPTVDPGQPQRIPAGETRGRGDVALSSSSAPLSRPGQVAIAVSAAKGVSPPSMSLPQDLDTTSKLPETSRNGINGQPDPKAATTRQAGAAPELGGRPAATPEAIQSRSNGSERLASAPNTPPDQADEPVRDGLRPSADRSAASASPAMPAQTQSRPVTPTPTSWLAELFETDFVRTLLQLKTLPLDPQAAARTSAQLGSEKTVAEPPLKDGAASETFSSAAEDAAQTPEAATSNPGDERPQPLPIPLHEQTLLRNPVVRDGMPLPFVPYLIADDGEMERVEEEEEDEDSRGRDERDTGQDAEEEAADQDAHTAGETEVSGPVTAAIASAAAETTVSDRPLLPPPSDKAQQLQPEPAHELYLRMAGLT